MEFQEIIYEIMCINNGVYDTSNAWKIGIMNKSLSTKEINANQMFFFCNRLWMLSDYYFRICLFEKYAFIIIFR